MLKKSELSFFQNFRFTAARRALPTRVGAAKPTGLHETAGLPNRVRKPSRSSGEAFLLPGIWERTMDSSDELNPQRDKNQTGTMPISRPERCGCTGGFLTC